MKSPFIRILNTNFIYFNIIDLRSQMTWSVSSMENIGLQFISLFIEPGKWYDRFWNSDREHVESHVRFMARGSIF